MASNLIQIWFTFKEEMMIDSTSYSWFSFLLLALLLFSYTWIWFIFVGQTLIPKLTKLNTRWNCCFFSLNSCSCIWCIYFGYAKVSKVVSPKPSIVGKFISIDYKLRIKSLIDIIWLFKTLHFCTTMSRYLCQKRW